MPSISFTAHGRCARATYCEPITTGSVGLSVSFAFDAAWSGLQKTAIFRGSGMAVDLVLSGDAATVPPEVLTIPGGDLRIGVWGADPDGNVIIPTVWATVGEIVPGAAPSGFDPNPPTPSWAAQVQEISLNALNTANSVREDADAGKFDGATYTPAVSAGGDLSWTNDKEKPNPPTVNIKGPEGQPGQTGATPDISIGTVETLPPGSPATATITGTAENPVLSFGIPQGQQGAPGEVTQAEFDELADEVTRQKSAIEDNKLTLDFSQSRNGYRISNTVIAGAITYASSSATNVYDRVCKVRKNVNYRLRTISQSINTDGARVSAIVDGSSVIRQIVYPVYGTDSTRDIYFTACVDGFLSIGAASGNVEIELYENAYPDNTYVIPITADNTLSGSYGIDAGKLKYSTSNRRRCGFLSIPPCKYFSLVPLNGYRIASHKVDTENYASWINGNLSSPSFVLPKELGNYTVIISNYDTATNIVIPQDGIFGYLYTWDDQPYPEYCPIYSPDKIAQTCKIIEFSGHVQGCATDGTNILICNPNGRMALYGIKSKEAVLTKSFEADAYGHMNSATYYDGKYYVASMKSTGEIYVFDSTTLELVNTIIAKNGADEVITPWAICFDQINNKFCLENSNGLLVYDAAFVFQQGISWTDIQYEKTHVGQGCVCDENTYYSIASYATTSSAYWFIARAFDGTYKTTIKFVTNGQLEIEDGAYDYSTGMMYVTAMDNNANKSYIFAVNVKSQPNITVLLA